MREDKVGKEQITSDESIINSNNSTIKSTISIISWIINSITLNQKQQLMRKSKHVWILSGQICRTLQVDKDTNCAKKNVLHLRKMEVTDGNGKKTIVNSNNSRSCTMEKIHSVKFKNMLTHANKEQIFVITFSNIRITGKFNRFKKKINTLSNIQQTQLSSRPNIILKNSTRKDITSSLKPTNLALQLLMTINTMPMLITSRFKS